MIVVFVYQPTTRNSSFKINMICGFLCSVFFNHNRGVASGQWLQMWSGKTCFADQTRQIIDVGQIDQKARIELVISKG